MRTSPTYRPPVRPRRTRRGVTGMAMSLGLGVAASMIWLTFEVDQARARIAGQASAIVETLAGEAFALHHWLHTATVLIPPAEGTARVLSAVEATALEGHAARAPYLALPSGWTLTRLIARPAGQDNTPVLHGIVALSPPADANLLLREEVLGRVIAEAGGDGALDLAAPGTTVDAARDIAAMAWVFGGIDTRAVLRTPRAGYGMPRLLAPLDMGGNVIVTQGQVATDAAAVARLSHRDNARITLEGTLEAEEMESAGNVEIDSGLTVAGNATLAGLRTEQGLRVSDITATGQLLGTDRLSAERTLDMGSGSGPLAWDSMVVFGLGSLERTEAQGDLATDLGVFTTIPGTRTPPRLSVTQGRGFR